VIDLVDAALGPVTGIRAAHRDEPDLWHLMLAHGDDATSPAPLSLRLPVDPTVLAVEVYGDHGHRFLVGRATPAAQCFATLVDEFAAMVSTGRRTHPCDVHRGLHLQRIVEGARQRAEA